MPSDQRRRAMTSVRRCTAAALVLGLVAGAFGNARAQEASPQSDPREVRAREMFGVGRYAEALDLYGKLYAETAHPTYMRNIGRCYQNLGEPDKAISSFREYLRQAAELPPQQRSVVEGYIREMEELKVRRAPAEGNGPARATPPSAVSANASTDAKPMSSSTIGVTKLGPAKTAPTKMTTRTFLALSLGVAGVAGMVVGTVFGLKTRADNNQAEALCVPNGICPSSDVRNEVLGYRNDATQARNVSIVAFAVGGAAFVGGTLLMVIGRGAQSQASRFDVSFWVAGRDAGLTAAGRW